MHGDQHKSIPKSVDWITPPEIIRALGPFDLDPCASLPQPWPCARRQYTIEDDGLSQSWNGRVWLNPPYWREAWKWMRRLALHRNGIALLIARTETSAWFPWVWDYADAVLFIKGRLTFFQPDGTKPSGNAGAPSALIAYGSECRSRLYNCPGIPGKTLLIPPTQRKEESWEFPKYEFWDSQTLDDLAQKMKIQPATNIQELFGTWPGEENDGFESEIREIRHWVKKEI